MKINNIFLLFAVFLIRCSGDSTQALQTDFEINLAKWKKLDINDYNFSQTISWYCSEEYRLPKEIRVRRGVIVSVNGEDYNPDVNYNFRTINEFFDFIEAKAKANLSYFDFSFNKQYGFPNRIALDPIEQIADDEVTYRLSNFKY